MEFITNDFHYNYKVTFLDEPPSLEEPNVVVLWSACNFPTVDELELTVRIDRTELEQPPVIVAVQKGIFGINGVFAGPNPDHVFLVSEGDGYFVDLNAANRWSPLKVYPLLGVRPDSLQEVLLFHSCTDVVAYDTHGLRWETDNNFAMDDVVITEVDLDTVYGDCAVCHGGPHPGSFQIDLKTGKYRRWPKDLGGAPNPLRI